MTCANRWLDVFINSVTWLYGAEVLPVSIRSRIMGVSAAAHYIVNVGRECTHLGKMKNQYLRTSSHTSRTERIRKHRRELLLCIRWVLHHLLGHHLLLLSRDKTEDTRGDCAGIWRSGR